MTPMATDKRKALGRGLGALIPAAGSTGSGPTGQATDGSVVVHAYPVRPSGSPARSDFFLCPIEEIAPSRDNPRQRFDEERLNELADSIRAQGLVQPLVVRALTAEDPKPAPGISFALIAGERRWRAAQRAGLRDVPVVVKDVSAASAFELALVENLQREDLNPMEEAEAYRRLSEEFGYTQEELARRVGKDRATVANSLRLLKLPGKARELVVAGQLSMGHARALLGLESVAAVEDGAAQVVGKGLSVRQTEELVRRLQKGQASEGKRGANKGEESEAAPKEKSPGVRDVEERLQRALGTRVQLNQASKTSGTVEIHYHSLDELDGLILRLTGAESD
jgi:ParB family transcriptional regulator, chromosome partitioning protein